MELFAMLTIVIFLFFFGAGIFWMYMQNWSGNYEYIIERDGTETVRGGEE